MKNTNWHEANINREAIAWGCHSNVGSNKIPDSNVSEIQFHQLEKPEYITMNNQPDLACFEMGRCSTESDSSDGLDEELFDEISFYK